MIFTFSFQTLNHFALEERSNELCALMESTFNGVLGCPNPQDTAEIKRLKAKEARRVACMNKRWAKSLILGRALVRMNILIE